MIRFICAKNVRKGETSRSFYPDLDVLNKIQVSDEQKKRNKALDDLLDAEASLQLAPGEFLKLMKQL